MRRVIPLAAAALTGALMAGPAAGQVDSTLAQEGVFNRPFIGSVSSTSIGGYVEGNTNYFVQDGVSEGFSMELRRFNVFLFSQVSRRVRFLSELEFEHGAEEITLETALLDVQIAPAFVVRAGIILPPIGFLNQNHDSPRWDFVERPLVTTTLVPSTLSEVGFGAYGRVTANRVTLSYDVYLTNGLGDAVVGNAVGRTDIPSGKAPELLAEDNNGSPAISARAAIRSAGLGEIGLSYYGGFYNSFRVDGQDVDEKRWLALTAVDFRPNLGALQVRGEVAYASIDVPPGLAELFGDSQWGGHVDVTLPVWRPRSSDYPAAVVSAGLRLERVDYNAGTFESTGLSIGDEVTAIAPGLSFRPTPGTVLRLNYRYEWTRDVPGNPSSRKAGFQIGFASYF